MLDEILRVREDRRRPGRLRFGSVAAILAVVSGAAGGAWLLLTHRKVRAGEVRWEAMNSDKPAPPPSS